MSDRTLILTLVGAQLPQGIRDSHEFRQCGGSIGRADDCDWMLAAPGISRTHAVVRYVHGLYFLEDRSTNGMLRNGAALARGEPVTLDDGDRLQMDSFELVARLVDAAPAPVAAAPVPFDDDRTIMVPASAAPGPEAAYAHADPHGHDGDPWDFGLVPPPAAAPAAPSMPSAPVAHGASPFAAETVDPLDALLSGFASGSVPPELDPLRLFDPLPAAPPAAGDHWNHANASADHFRPPPAAAPMPVLPEEWDLTRGDFGAPPSSATAAVRAPHPPAGSQVDAIAGDAMPEEVDAILRVVVDGVMEVLRARAEIKNTFRLPVTIIQRSENNPLKFAATPDEAMRRLLRPDGGFLGGAAAFDDAFDDIRCHQMAMLAGMRAAFESLLSHFSPDRIEREADSAGRRAFSGKGRYWDRYRDEFTRAAKDPDASFRMLFGDEFARAYEAQLARLKSARRRAPR